MKSGFSVYALCLFVGLSLFGCSGFKPMSVSYKCGEPEKILTCCDTDGHKTVKPNKQCSEPKNIVILLDGTDNDWKTRTNVRRLYEIISNQDRHDMAVYYDEGVGSDFRKLTGNAFGNGFAENVRQAYRFLARQYTPGDKIYIFGFSRGAATARSLSGMVRYVGLLDKGVLEATKQKMKLSDIYKGEEIETESMFTSDPVYDIFKIYTISHKGDFAKKLATLKEKYKMLDEVPIRVVGVWDTVESLGFPILDPKKPAPDDDRYRIELHDNIDYAFHALAIDETRIPFQPLIWDQEDLTANNLVREKKRMKKQELEQVWFAGVHSDIGGGYGDSKDLSGITLNWMLAKLEKTEGYDLITSSYRVYENPLGEKHKSHTGYYDATKEKVRHELQCGAKIHSSVIQRIAGLKDGDRYDYWPAQFNDGANKINKTAPLVLNNCFEIVE